MRLSLWRFYFFVLGRKPPNQNTPSKRLPREFSFLSLFYFDFSRDFIKSCAMSRYSGTIELKCLRLYCTELADASRLIWLNLIKINLKKPSNQWFIVRCFNLLSKNQKNIFRVKFTVYWHNKIIKHGGEKFSYIFFPICCFCDTFLLSFLAGLCGRGAKTPASAPMKVKSTKNTIEIKLGVLDGFAVCARETGMLEIILAWGLRKRFLPDGVTLVER